MCKKIFYFILVYCFFIFQSYSYENILNDIIANKQTESKKNFQLPGMDNLMLNPGKMLNLLGTVYKAKMINQYVKVVHKINFLGIDCSDLVFTCGNLITGYVYKKDSYNHQLNIDILGIFFKYGIYVGLDGGYSYIMENRIKVHGPFANISFGWEYFGLGICKFYFGGAWKISGGNNTFPIWWAITPFSKSFRLKEINSKWSLRLNVEVLFKRLISVDCRKIKENFKERTQIGENVLIPFFKPANYCNCGNTYFGFHVFLEIQYNTVDKTITF